ncbi:hypothetical protein JOD29_003692 [Lysinibacillus composti]|nr:hypothetical protein [Lysinibacillus composti]
MKNDWLIIDEMVNKAKWVNMVLICVKGTILLENLKIKRILFILPQ